MRILGNLLRTDIKRAILSRNFLLTSILLMFIELLSAGQMLINTSYSVMDILDNIFSGSGSVMLILLILPLFPYALTYAKDEQEGAVAFWEIRCRAGFYMIGKFCASVFSAFLAVVCSFCLTVVVLTFWGHPLTRTFEGSGIGYYELLTEGKTYLFLLCYLIDRGLGAGLAAAVAVLLAAIWKNPYLSFAGPVCVYLLMMRLLPGANVGDWVEGYMEYPGNPGMMLLSKAAGVLIMCAVMCGLCIMIVRRRWRCG